MSGKEPINKSVTLPSSFSRRGDRGGHTTARRLGPHLSWLLGEYSTAAFAAEVVIPLINAELKP